MEVFFSEKIKWIPEYRNAIKLAFNKRHNIINIDGLDYELQYLNQIKGSKGGNSNVFLLVDPTHPESEDAHLVIKICNRPLERSDEKYKRKYQRELIALRIAKSSGKKGIIQYFHHGIAVISNLRFPFYTMEKADCDLANYLNENKIEVDQKLLLCLSIIQAFKELHSLNIYHRDIKHDNILIFSQEGKIGDMGLVKYREDDLEFVQSEKGDRIGAFGWESPETMNKYLTEKNHEDIFDCEIDSISDIFQLGKLFWYIFQGNLPIGQITREDFMLKNEDIFEVIFKMIQYSKKPHRRFQSIEEIEDSFKKIANDLFLI